MNIQELFGLEGKVAVVTGGSGGIGYMIAQGLVCARVKVYICGRRQPALEAAAAALGAFGTCVPVVADLGTDAGITHLGERVSERERALNILVNNAGATWAAPLDSFPRSGFEKVLNTNVTAPFQVVRCLLPQLRRGASGGDPARIINVASISGLEPPPRETYPYSASKAALIMLTRHLAQRLTSDNITVNAIAPGIFESKMTQFMFDRNHPQYRPPPEFPLGRAGRPDDMAGAVIYLASRAGSYVTGVTLPVAGGGGLE